MRSSPHRFYGHHMEERRQSFISQWYPMIGVLALSSVAALLFIAHTSTRTELEMPWEYGRFAPYQNLAQAQPSLMDEGSIQMDPSKVQDAAAEFFKQNEESTQTDDDVPDAGPGHILPGWTHPELVEPPNPVDLQSFEAPSGRTAVYSPDDYVRNPGAVEAVENARSTIANLQDSIATAHQEAESAKAVYEKEAAKTKELEQEYQKYAQAMRNGRARNHNWSYYKDSKKAINMWAAPTSDQRAAHSYRAADAQPQQAAAGDNQDYVIDGSSPDAAAEYRRRFYEESSPVQQTLVQQYQQPVVQQSLLSFPASSNANSYQEQVKDQGLLEQEEQAIRDRSAKVQLAKDVARLQLARKRLADAVSRPSVFKARPLHFQEFCPDGTPGCEGQSQLHLEDASGSAVGGQSEDAMRTAGDREVPMGVAERQKPHWIGEAFMQ